jgi:hypoxanthine phosphoribosyltransferase
LKISKTLITEEEIGNKISEIANEINEKYKGEELVVIGILKGAFIVISDLAKQLQIDVAFDFMSIKSYYGSESSGQVKIVKDLEYDISNKNVLIVEDIYDTGLTLSNLKKLLESRNPKSVEIFCMFIKKGVSQDLMDINYRGFEIGPEFVVGYGLDYNGKYRELPYLAVLS